MAKVMGLQHRLEALFPLPQMYTKSPNFMSNPVLWFGGVQNLRCGLLTGRECLRGGRSHPHVNPKDEPGSSGWSQPSLGLCGDGDPRRLLEKERGMEMKAWRMWEVSINKGKSYRQRNSIYTLLPIWGGFCSHFLFLLGNQNKEEGAYMAL